MQHHIEFVEDESQLESDEDISSLGAGIFNTAVLSGNDWTAETIITQINKGNIQLNPKFQRRDAWDKERKSKFIESLILGLPVPQVVLAESRDRRGAYIVLDGKQRLLSIRQFAASDSDPVYEQLRLTNLEIRSDLKGYDLDALRNDADRFDDLAAFENQPIRTVVIKNWPSENFLYHIFLRLNTGSVPLSPQELRQALHPGLFVSFLDERSSSSPALREILKISKPDFRMRDAELLLRFIAFSNFYLNYSGSLKDFLDDTCLKLNSHWSSMERTVVEQADSLEKAHCTVKSIFGENSYRKWSVMGYESRFNRSVFDVMTLSMSNENVRNAIVGKERLVEDAFIELCATDISFRSSLETTTKTLAATHKRISTWFSKMSELLGIDLPTFDLLNDRIV
ncbi:DUF262 domain-containing protein [Delftia tsuruhatensis]|jgi:hypothetical protein|uniref:DUF262 domain-containing protein n=1 Tax=Delftia tsuruhatensis TaxID=180282 RepID=UPI0028A0823F|nr:DUF262 domain-containing protein [Delftia tsuruhatensis]